MCTYCLLRLPAVCGEGLAAFLGAPFSDCIASCHRIHANPSSFLCLYHLSMPQFAWIRWHEAMQSMNGGHKKAAKPSPHTAGPRSQPVSYPHLRTHRHLRNSYALSCLKKKKYLAHTHLYD